MQYCYYKHNQILYHHSMDEKPYPPEFYLHTHDTAEILCFLSGEGIFHIEGSEYPLHPGDVVIMRPTESHYIEIEETAPYERIAFNFPLSLLEGLPSKNFLISPFTDRKAGRDNVYAASLFSADYIGFYADKVRAKGGEIYLLPFLHALLAEIGHIHEKGWNRTFTRETIEHRVMQYIKDHPSERLSVEWLSKKYFLSPAQLERRFKKATGTTIAEYAATKRMIYAKSLLSKGLRPTEIYERCGFTDYSAFYRSYRKYFHESPRKRFGTSA